MNTQGVKASIDISAKDNGLDKEIQNVVKLNTEMQKLAQQMSKTAIYQQKLATEVAKTNTQNEKTSTQMAKTIGQHQKNAAAKEQDALKTEKLRIQVEKLNSASSKSSGITSLFSSKLFLMGSNLSNLASSAKIAANKIYELTESASSYIETQNLFEVSMGPSIDKATQFVNEMSNAYNLNDEGLKQSVGTFNLLGTQMGLTTDQAYLYSETLTKLSADMASLRNSSVDVATSKLKSGIVGEVEALRQWGIDVSEATLKQEALANGITKSYDKMTYGEKSLLRYSAILRQTSADQGDFARTLESPAQLMKQFREQLAATGRAIGTLFLAPLQKVLPVLIAILMVIRHIAEWLATLFGITGSFGDDSANTSLDIAEGTSNALGEAVNNAKKLKKYLGGFDEINNVTPKEDASSGAGGLGIDDSFLKLLQGYDNQMSSVSNKASEVRDRIMEWLGFTKQVDEETGKVSFKFDHLTGGSIATLLVGLLGALSILSKINNFLNITGFVSQVGEVAKYLMNISGLTGAFDDIYVAISGAAQGLWSWKEALALIGQGVSTIATVVAGVVLVVAGIVRLVQGIQALFNNEIFIGVLRVIEGIALVVAGIILLLGGGWLPALIAAIVAAVAFVVELIYSNWETIKGWFTGMGEWFAGIWESFYTTVIEPIVNFFAGFAQWIYDNVIAPVVAFFTPIVEAVMSVISTIIYIIQSIYNFIVETIVSIISTIVEVVVGIGETIWGIVSVIGEVIWTIISKIWEILTKIIEIGIAIAKAVYDYVIAPIIEFIVNLVTTIWNWLNEKIITPVRNFITGLVEAISGFVQKLMDGVKKVVDWIIEKVTWIKDKALGLFKGIVETVVNFVSGIFKSIFNGIFSAIENMINGFIKLLNGAIGIINKIPGVDIKKVTEIKLPRFENGGMPAIGSLFVAGEGKTTEFVGDIGGRTNVVNEMQLENALYNAMIRANKNKNDGATVNEIYIGGNKTDTILAKRSQRNGNILGRGGLAYNG